MSPSLSVFVLIFEWFCLLIIPLILSPLPSLSPIAMNAWTNHHIIFAPNVDAFHRSFYFQSFEPWKIHLFVFPLRRLTKLISNSVLHVFLRFRSSSSLSTIISSPFVAGALPSLSRSSAVKKPMSRDS